LKDYRASENRKARRQNDFFDSIGHCGHVSAGSQIREVPSPQRLCVNSTETALNDSENNQVQQDIYGDHRFDVCEICFDFCEVVIIELPRPTETHPTGLSTLPAVISARLDEVARCVMPSCLRCVS
jgi:hypothetical protein